MLEKLYFEFPFFEKHRNFTKQMIHATCVNQVIYKYCFIVIFL